jgi:ComF family protein
MDAGTGSALVHALKYGGWPDVAHAMARRMARVDLPPDVVAERTALVPVPLSSTRERERGHNQAERLATALASHWHLPVWRAVLRRSRHTQSQVRLTPSERSSNVSRAFETNATAQRPLQGAHVILIDDVVTTAATLNAAARALTDGGARIISYVTFGRAPDPGDRTDSDFDPDQD